MKQNTTLLAVIFMAKYKEIVAGVIKEIFDVWLCCRLVRTQTVCERNVRVWSMTEPVGPKQAFKDIWHTPYM